MTTDGSPQRGAQRSVAELLAAYGAESRSASPAPPPEPEPRDPYGDAGYAPSDRGGSYGSYDPEPGSSYGSSGYGRSSSYDDGYGTAAPSGYDTGYGSAGYS